MTTSPTSQELGEHFAHCVQVFGGTTPTARRLGIDERAIRRFISGDRPVSKTLMKDTATALQKLIAEATAAEAHIAAAFAGEPD